MKLIHFDHIDKYDLKHELLASSKLCIVVDKKQAKRFQNDCSKFDKYKIAYAENNSKKGLFLSFVWMLSNIYTSLVYGELEKVTVLYYELYPYLMPVYITTSGEGILVTFELKKTKGK